ncbi:MAG: hypothetical protein JSW52_11805 [Candidatus Coatesbacteria bacterium]|nr:MAG: hypothetical protein JSW52_11805 [Candidatus Coatesbacteria bacterium]
MRIFLAAVIALGFFVYAGALELGEECPPLNRPEVVTAGGGLGAYVNVDDYLAADKTFLVSFGYDT